MVQTPVAREHRGRPPGKPGWLKRGAAFATAAITATGLTMAGAAPASAAPDDVSESLGKFLGGSAVGIDLDDLAEINGALAENPSGENPLVTNPLGAEVLNSIGADLGGGIQLFGPNGVIALGAVNQYAEAQDDGTARAASGAVTDQGAIAVGGSDAFPSDASLNLDALLPEGTEGLITDLSLDVGALSSNIEQVDGGAPVSDYQVAGATLNLESPAVGGIYTELLNTIDALQGDLNGLSDTLSDGLSTGIDLGGLADLSTSVDFTPPDLSALLPDTVVGESSGVTVDLTTGAVTVDLETLLAANPELPNLNEMPANSELLSGPVLAAISDGITQAVTDVVTEIVTNVQDTVSATSLGLDADVVLLGGAAGIQVEIDANLAQILAGESEGAVQVSTSGLIGLLNPLLEFLGLSGPNGVGDLIFNTVGSILGNTLDVLSDLEGVVDEITGPLATEVVGPLLEVVNQVAAVTVNAQPEVGDLGEGSSTVRALQVTLVPGATLAQVDLASSTVRGTDDEAVLDPSVTVTPESALPGEDVAVEGSGYTPDSTVTVEITDADGNVIDTLTEVPTDGEGNFATDWTVPEGIDPGELTVTATDDTDPEASDSATLTIGDEDGEFDTSIAADPVEVEQGAETLITGSGFAPGESVTVSIPGADPVTTEADEDGNISVSLPIPGDYDLGAVEVTAVGDV